jgi:hypothetical protein
VRVVVQLELVLHGEDWCNHEYGPAFFRRPHDTSAPTPFAAREARLTLAVSRLRFLYTRLLCSQALFVLLARGPFSSRSPVSHDCRLCHLSKFPAPFREHESSHRLVCTACLPVCFGPYISIPVLCVLAHYREGLPGVRYRAAASPSGCLLGPSEANTAATCRRSVPRLHPKHLYRHAGCSSDMLCASSVVFRSNQLSFRAIQNCTVWNNLVYRL